MKQSNDNAFSNADESALVARPASSLLRSLWAGELAVSESYRGAATAMVAIFAVVYAAAFLGLMQYVAYLGPGLGDELNFSPYLQLFNRLLNAASGNYLEPKLFAFVLLTAINLMFSAGIIFLGYSLYPKIIGKPFPLTVLLTFFALNGVCTVGIFSIQFIIAIGAYVLGFDFWAALTAFSGLLDGIRDSLQQVPTLIDLPKPAAFFVLMMVGGFFHYWFHRLAHESRLLWLLFHRTHHMTPQLIQPSTQSVFNAFPLFLFVAVPYVVIFSVLGKLISTDSMLDYLIVFKLFSAFANLFSHQTALYDWAKNQTWVKVLSTITSEGVYHYMHHSAERDDYHSRGNIYNVGGGLFFCWDRVFGTYKSLSDKRPRVGLQEVSEGDMSTNPIRLALAGVAQVWYELRHNRGIKTRLAIVFGPSDYVPPSSYDYVLRESAASKLIATKST